MSNGNCGQQESSCNPLTGVDKMGRKETAKCLEAQRRVYFRRGPGGGGGTRPSPGSAAHVGLLLWTVEEAVRRAQQENRRAGDEWPAQRHR